MRSSAPLLVSLVGLVLAGVSGTFPAAAQGSAGESARVPIAIVVTDSFPYPNAGAVILRRPAGSPHDVIILPRSDARADALTTAVFHLLILRSREGDFPAQPSTYRVPARLGPIESMRGETRVANQVLSRLRTSRARRVPDLPGNVQIAIVYLPNQAMQAEWARRGRFHLRENRP